MFDLVTGKTAHIPRRPLLPLLISTVLQAVILAAAIGVPILVMTDQLPKAATMMAFVAEVPAAPPPPPPPPPAAKAPPRTEARPARAPEAPLAPRDVRTEPLPEPLPGEGRDDEGLPHGVEGGIAGGVPGGIVGGVVGGVPGEAPVPPPPPPVAGPIRVAGQIDAPELLHRVNPAYPDVAVAARIQGTVILEAIVGETGRVEEVKVLRSVNPLLDREAVAAVRQWRYSPLILNGRPARFILTVTLSFNLQQAGSY